jgi:hypothetical protein
MSFRYNSGHDFFQSGQNFPLVELGARLVVGSSSIPFLNIDDGFTVDGLPVVDGQPPMTLEKNRTT